MSLSLELPEYQAAKNPESVVWGMLQGSAILTTLNNAYTQIARWKPNLFLTPSGSVGKAFIDELTRLASLFVNKTSSESFALTALMVCTPLLLQKPSKKSKTKEHAKHLQRRLALWKEGDIEALVREGNAIQARMSNSVQVPSRHINNVFSSLMMKGKVSSAIKWLNSNAECGVLKVNDTILMELHTKHPAGKKADVEFLLHGPLKLAENVIFDGIDEETVCNAAKNLKGTGGPSGLNSDGVKRILCSKAFRSSSKNLCYALSLVIRRLCTEFVDPECTKALNACRLIPLNKNPGVRPIGIGEVFKRIIAKCVMKFLKPDIPRSAGSLQVCAGHDAGCEAAIHAIKDMFAEEDVDGVLLVDASNAFNSLNREVALRNMFVTCPEMAVFETNMYRSYSSLYVKDLESSEVHEILSEEGTTQGDPSAMPVYSCSTTPLITALLRRKEESHLLYRQVWFADDAASAGNIDGLNVWWKKLLPLGPGYGYYPNPQKKLS